MVTRFVYDASGNLLAEADASGTIQRYYIHGVGLMALVTASGELYVYHHDRTGHTVALTDAQAAVVNRYAYSPYGRVLAREEAIAQPFTFVGQYGVMDEGEGFYYMRARYYDTQSGRFISEDPAGFVDGPNLYAYVGGNPVAAVDPYGLSAERRNPPVASSPGSVLTPPVSGAVSPKLGVPPRGALDTEGDYRLLTGEPKCDGFSAGCQSGGSFGYPAVVRISGKNLCRDCAIKFLGIENLARPEQREILQPFEPK